MDTQNHNLCLNLIFISNLLEGKYTGIVQQLAEKKNIQRTIILQEKYSTELTFCSYTGQKDEVILYSR